MKDDNDRKQIRISGHAAEESFKSLDPFTITITSGNDAMFLSMALMVQMMGSVEMADKAMQVIAATVAENGPEKALDQFFSEARENNVDYPDFMKPLMTMMYSHIVNNKDRILEIIKEHEGKNEE